MKSTAKWHIKVQINQPNIINGTSDENNGSIPSTPNKSFNDVMTILSDTKPIPITSKNEVNETNEVPLAGSAIKYNKYAIKGNI